MNYILIVLVVAIAAVVFISMSRNKEAESPEEPVSNPVEEVEPDKVEIAIEKIVESNIALRTSGVDTSIVSEVESLFDELIEVVQLVNKTENYTENTPLINRMANHYLPNFLGSYIGLDKIEQEKQSDQFKKGIITLKETIHSAKDTLNKEDKAEFNKQVGFVKAFFEGDYNGGEA
jgi:hypothetical protein